ncbi:MAG: hypothetical protein JW797_13565 [Bradymonadales bacterium]|nr:hypothetical protein [Bradymonadales bacterium]
MAAPVSDLDHLNDARYLAHQQLQLDTCRQFAAGLARPCRLVEIGSERGIFSRWLAERHPSESVLALEWREKWVREATRVAHRRGLANLHTLRANARVALPIIAPPRSIWRLFILFPDPWWKRKHEGRRLLDIPFFHFLAGRLEPGGLLCIKTDIRLIHQQILSMAREVDELESVNPLDWPDERDWAPTQREAHCLASGTAVYRLYFRGRPAK